MNSPYENTQNSQELSSEQSWKEAGWDELLDSFEEEQEQEEEVIEE
jgi:hypothetical protein